MKTHWKNDRQIEDFADNPVINFAGFLVFLSLIAIALKLFVVNLTPYFLLMGQEAVEPSGTPIIGWLFDALFALFFGMGAVIAWSLVNGAQILWLLIRWDKAAYRGAIKIARQDASTSAADNHGDRRGNRDARKAERHISKIPFLFISYSGLIALGAFVVDLIVNLNAYPVIKSWPRFFAGLAIGDFSPIDARHLLALVVSLFSTELIAVALVVVGSWIWTRRQGLTN
jgi:hypothetical protein